MSELTKPLRVDGSAKRARVVIVGAGFGGIHAALALRRLPVDVTVVDRRNHHIFQPLLYQVALAVLSPADIAQPIRTILRRQQNTEVLMDEVIAIDVQSRVVSLASGALLPYDYLVFATGATHSYFGKDEWASQAPGLKTIEDAIEIRRRVLLAFELAERQMQEHGWHPPLNFVVIGGGPTGVELAGAISDIAKLYMRHDFRHIDPTKARVLLLDNGPRVLAAYPEDLSAKAERELFRLGVEVHTKSHVTGVGPGWVEANNQRIDAGGNALGRRRPGLAAGQDARARPPTSAAASSSTHNSIRLACPKSSSSATSPTSSRTATRSPASRSPPCRWATTSAKIIAADLANQRRPAFRYFDKGDMATIGRMAAVAKVEWPFKAHMSGFPAWVTWIVVHIFFLIGFRNRIAVFSPVGLDLLHLHPRRTTHHRRPAPPRLARPDQRRSRQGRRRPRRGGAIRARLSDSRLSGIRGAEPERDSICSSSAVRNPIRLRRTHSAPAS